MAAFGVRCAAFVLGVFLSSTALSADAQLQYATDVTGWHSSASAAFELNTQGNDTTLTFSFVAAGTNSALVTLSVSGTSSSGSTTTVTIVPSAACTLTAVLPSVWACAGSIPSTVVSLAGGTLQYRGITNALEPTSGYDLSKAVSVAHAGANYLGLLSGVPFDAVWGGASLTHSAAATSTYAAVISSRVVQPGRVFLNGILYTSGACTAVLPYVQVCTGTFPSSAVDTTGSTGNWFIVQDRFDSTGVYASGQLTAA